MALHPSRRRFVGSDASVGAPVVLAAEQAGGEENKGDRMERQAVDVLTARDVSILLRVNIKTVYESAKSGTIPCVRLGRHFRFSRRAVMARLEPCKSAPSWEGH
jgi:excisionase family DNA binding protein